MRKQINVDFFFGHIRHAARAFGMSWSLKKVSLY